MDSRIYRHQHARGMSVEWAWNGRRFKNWRCSLRRGGITEVLEIPASAPPLVVAVPSAGISTAPVPWS